MPTYEQWKKENWNRAHLETDMSALTGTGLGGHLHTLGAMDLLTEETSLLCIGVGNGEWVQDAAKKAKFVSALDVSPIAQRRMPAGAICYAHSSQLPAQTFNLALSLWVAPHMSNFDLEHQLRHVFRALKSEGIFALHYKEPLDPSQPLDNKEGTEDEWRVAAQANVMRRRGYFEQLVKRNGGKVVKIAQEMKSQYHGINEVSIHLTRSD